jgi:hypothetical protein
MKEKMEGMNVCRNKREREGRNEIRSKRMNN